MDYSLFSVDCLCINVIYYMAGLLKLEFATLSLLCLVFFSVTFSGRTPSRLFSIGGGDIHWFKHGKVTFTLSLTLTKNLRYIFFLRAVGVIFFY